MKSLLTQCFVAVALSATFATAGLAAPLHMTPSHDSPACKQLQAMTKKLDGRYDRVDFTRCAASSATSPAGAPDPDRLLSE